MSEGTERRAAHERLSTGGLSSWMRRCATHPWRVIGAWVGILVVLVVLTISFAGSLRDEFEIPGSDTQKATDLIEAEFVEEQGGVLNVVFAVPPGQRLDTPEHKQAIDEAITRLRGAEFKPTEDKAGLESVATPFTEDTVSDDGRIAYAEAQFDRVVNAKDRDSVVAVQDAVRETVEPAGVTVEFNGEAEFPPIEQGTQELLGLLAALIVLLIVFRTFVATSIPLALAITAVGTAFLLLFLLAGLTDINTITPLLVSMIGIGVGIDYSLFIVTRFRSSCTTACRRPMPQPRRCVSGSSGALRRPDGRDLRERPRDLRPRLRDEARHRLGARRPHHRPDRELAAHRGLAKLGHKVDRLKCPSCARSTTRTRPGRRPRSPAGAGSSPGTRRSCSRCCS